ncbi:MAG: ABC transporter substrate-binding protein [Candidatus Rokubacteria bacterium]|nr:ABC transporter substrate-binding protein [Candidatus Rokubacteria bacterium]
MTGFPTRPWARAALTALLVASALTAPVSAPRADAAAAPTEEVKGAITRVLKVLEDPALKAAGKEVERRAAIRQVANDMFDFGEMSRRSLGRHWRDRSPKEREEFVALFADLLERSYISRIETYSGERIQYTSERQEGDLGTVMTKIITKNGTEVPVEYRLHKKGDKWLIYDVGVEGVSLINNYRTQFNKIIQTSSYEDLVRRMKTKQDEIRGDADAPTRKN